jgi:coenzyme F420-0:L-glutamate ligase / coenzyme F420-1:gamma-L-glutamate ligase
MPVFASRVSMSTPNNPLALIPLTGLPLVEPGDDLAGLLIHAAMHCAGGLRVGDLLVIAQKIVSKSEDRYVDLATITPSPRALELAPAVDKDPRIVEIVLRESREVLRHRKGAIVVEHKLGWVHANAGVDRSNIDGEERVLLLPADPDRSARELRDAIARRAGVEVFVIINDSAGRAFRNGVVGFALGTAGFEPLVNRIGDPDLFGKKLEITEVAVADELAAAASFLMGQADEGIPAVVIRGARLQPAEQGMRALIRSREQDLFR